MKIHTHFDYPPIPVRDMDYSAVDDDTYDEGGPVGHGATEEAAIDDLADLWLLKDGLDEDEVALEAALAMAGGDMPTFRFATRVLLLLSS